MAYNVKTLENEGDLFGENANSTTIHYTHERIQAHETKPTSLYTLFVANSHEQETHNAQTQETNITCIIITSTVTSI